MVLQYHLTTFCRVLVEDTLVLIRVLEAVLIFQFCQIQLIKQSTSPVDPAPTFPQTFQCAWNYYDAISPTPNTLPVKI